ncbi:MAG TPA: bacteriohopanetetrol glucosamine biosynthesis glycosyltransferase HpnI [Rhizomicrobium sp.]|jgi:ceramide glucosyltransferase|nr:bacteriohopanetetrol glucosamine biosynthesis glycosyltransferase HpnI [Rhizomicrobium sp.]
MLAEIAAALAIFGNLTVLAGLVVALHFAARPAQAPKKRPAITILKPLCGEEPGLEEALASCCNQIYPAFQIVFGLHSRTDPALAVAKGLQARFPERDIAVVVDPRLHGPNRKVSNLINMLPWARHELLVISDSDLHVPPDYLDRLVVEMEKPATGLVTCASFGRPPAGLGWLAKLDAAQMTYTYLPGVLLSRVLGRQDCLGSTTMLARQTLDRIGGLAPLAGVLAEDNVMGQRIRGLGLSIGLADVVVAATVSRTSPRAVWHHELRWARTIRASAPLVHAVSVLQYPLFWAALACALSGAAIWSIALSALSLTVRASSMMAINAVLRRKAGHFAHAGSAWLLPLRDFLSVIEIGASFCIEDVVWRGHKINANGLAADRTAEVTPVMRAPGLAPGD